MVFKIRLSVSYKFIEKSGFCILYEKNLYFMRKATWVYLGIFAACMGDRKRAARIRVQGRYAWGKGGNKRIKAKACRLFCGQGRGRGKEMLSYRVKPAPGRAYGGFRHYGRAAAFHAGHRDGGRGKKLRRTGYFNQGK